MNIPLNIDWQQILLHFFNFSILVGGLYLLLFKPVKDFMAKREQHYQAIDDDAAAKLREAEEKVKSADERVAALHVLEVGEPYLTDEPLHPRVDGRDVAGHLRVVGKLVAAEVGEVEERPEGGTRNDYNHYNIIQLFDSSLVHLLMLIM